MAYKTILVHVDEAPHSAARILLAGELALQEGAHVVGVATTGVSRFLYQNETVDEHDPNLARHLDILRERAGRALAEFAPRLQALGVQSLEQRILDDDASAGLSLMARHADLVIVGQLDARQRGPDVPAEVLAASGKPVLVVPLSARPSGTIAVTRDGIASSGGPAPARHILAAWNASREAGRALQDALPLLRRAERVTVAIFDAETRPGVFGEPPGADILAWLARHGVSAHLVLGQGERQGLLKRGSDIGGQLLALAAERDCDLLVMGAYGHSRLRETLLGGVTRSVLDAMTLPLLMSH
ncbi:universal stress protein [Pseudoduganella sp. DS3]|uniref:Universal stress protein n=1 Tax=Pseudoduganella guangdongensis TaxID=2692179 RepID=A0A6N9HGB0_9BURK|nr:universal stress protein [Pseudoduganella guangdongensis]MYN02062.1 universal stress protein [Pseudoduganella guangdongensis]